jgi:hypothetical protein
MADEQQALARDFISSFRGALEQVAVQAPVEEPDFLRRLRDHFGADPAQLPVLTESFPNHDHPNLHLALEAYLAEPERSGQVVGITTRTSIWRSACRSWWRRFVAACGVAPT